MRCALLRPMIIPQSVSLSVMQAGCAKTAERIDVLFGAETTGDPRNIVLDGGSHPPRRWEGVRCGLCQITLATCLLSSAHPSLSVASVNTFCVRQCQLAIVLFAASSVVLMPELKILTKLATCATLYSGWLWH